MHERKPDGKLKLPEREIEFAELPTGGLAEMIEDPTNPAKSLLALYRNGTVRYVARLRVGNEILVPLPRSDPASQHVCLPQGAESYGGPLDLFTDVGAALAACLDLPPESLRLMVAHMFSSWLPDKLRYAPYLALVGPPSSGKTTALGILSLFYRRSLLISDVTSAGFLDVCDRVHPTILIDETRTAGHPRMLLHLLRCSNSRDFIALRKGKAQMAYGPKVLSWIELPNDAALNSRCVIIPMHKTSRTDLTSPDDPRILKFARNIRMRLLQFRFEHYRSLSIPRVPTDVRLSSRALDLYRALALPFGENQEFCSDLARLIACQRKFQPSLLSPAQASAVRVLHAFLNRFPSSDGARVKHLTAQMNLDLERCGEPSGLNERKVGDILTSLGLTNRSRQNVGYVLWLYSSDRERIHEMARNYEIYNPTDPAQNCEVCRKSEGGRAVDRPEMGTAGQEDVRLG